MGQTPTCTNSNDGLPPKYLCTLQSCRNAPIQLGMSVLALARLPTHSIASGLGLFAVVGLAYPRAWLDKYAGGSRGQRHGQRNGMTTGRTRYRRLLANRKFEGPYAGFCL
eukprot:GHVT01029446.1.p2 GENE.GHVT01029446.1~~GHVT01029446.1.p2  ORF type:complete len:110 (-),score=8.35 GHVT01029446.1:324-653(-)